MIAVLCSQQKHFHSWTKGWLKDEDLSKFRCVTNEQDIRGQKFTEVITIGPYWFIDNYEYLKKLIDSRIDKPVDPDKCSCKGWGCTRCCSSDAEIRSRQGIYG